MNLLNFLNLAELGISTAIGYVLYKPIFEHDEARINEIISVLGYMYRWIGRIIIAAGLLLSCFLPLIFPSTGFSYGIIYFAYYSFLASSLIGYFANYRQTLLGADQRNYVVAFYFQTASIIKILCQILSAWYTGSYYLWIMIELLFGIIYSFILNWKINQVYPWLKSNVALGKELFRKYPEVIKYTRQLFVHRLGYFFQFQVTPFLVYAFVSLQMVAYYGNYSTIMDKLFLLVNNLLGSTEASVGNLIAEGNAEKSARCSMNYFPAHADSRDNLLYPLPASGAIHHALAGSGLHPPPGNHDPDHHQPVHHCHAGCSGSIFIRLRPVLGCLGAHCRSVINISVAIIGGYLWGLPGILLGGISSLVLIVGIWKPFMLYTWGFRKNVMNYWLQFGYQLALILIPMVLMNWIWKYSPLQPSGSFLNWFACAFLMVVSYGVITILLMYCCTKGMRGMVHRGLAIAGTRLLWKRKK